MQASRRQFLQCTATLAATVALAPQLVAQAFAPSFFEISLAEWSLHKALFGSEMTNLDFPVRAKK